MNFQTIKEKLRYFNKQKLKGWNAQKKMAPPYRGDLIKKLSAENNPKKAAVLALIYPNKNNETTIALMKRVNYPGTHANQISFPGGGVEPQDKNYWQTALRETQEEFGIAPENLKKIGALTYLYIPPSNYDVFPFVALTDSKPNFRPNSTEVQSILEFQLKDFTITQNHIYIKNNKSNQIPAYQINDHIIWGATAMILAELLDYIKNA